MEFSLFNCIGFQWDSGNIQKNILKHEVFNMECEQVFFNIPLLLQVDQKHSFQENRFFVLGVTDFGRRLFIAFVIRERLIRVISARNMSKKERDFYENPEKNTSI